MEKGDVMWDYGDRVENFYFVLRGEVGIKVPNPNITRWQWAHALQKGL